MRYFLAIPLPEDIKKELHKINSSLSNFKGLKLVSPDNMHLTLLFLGEKNVSEKLEELKKTKFFSFELKLSKVSVFPEQGKIRLVWVELEKSSELLNLQKKLSKIFGVEKDYKPHITLARIKKIDNREREILRSYVGKIDLPKIKVQVKNFKLYSSELTVLGPVHRVIEYFEASSSKKK